MSHMMNMHCTKDKRRKSHICVPKGSKKEWMCLPRKEGQKAGGKKRKPSRAQKAWRDKLMKYKDRHGVSLKEAMEALASK